MIAFETGTFAVTAGLGAGAWLLRRRAPRIASIGIGLAMVFGMITAAEVVLRVAGAGDPVIDEEYPESYYAIDANGLLGPLPGSHHVVAKFIRDGSIHYDVTYTVDEFGRRVVPDAGGPYSSYAVFVGDSFTYGVGVEDDETLPAAYAHLHPDVHVYNYSFHGSGPFDVLAGLETADFPSQIAETSGTVIYTFIDEHVLRTSDFLLGAGYRGKRVVYEPDASGKLVRCGTWNTCHPWRHRFARYLSKSRLISLTHFEMPLTSEDFDRTAQAISQMNEVTRDRLRGGELLVVFYPGCRLASGLIPLLDARKIRCLDLSGTFDGTSPPYVLSTHDRHPNPDGYRRLAAAITTDRARPAATP